MKTPAHKAALYFRAIALLHASKAMREAAMETRIYCAETWKANEGPNRFPISGGICAHWPESVKEAVTSLVHEAAQLLQESYDTWRASGKRRETWLAKKEQIMGAGTTTF